MDRFSTHIHFIGTKWTRTHYVFTKWTGLALMFIFMLKYEHVVCFQHSIACLTIYQCGI